MAVGNQLTKSALDNWVGNFAQSFLNDLQSASQIATRIGLLTDTELTTLGYSAADLGVIRQFAADINALLTLATGATLQANLPAPFNAAYDWRTTTRKLTGTTT